MRFAPARLDCPEDVLHEYEDPQKEHDTRTEFERDRSRVLHAESFRRLQEKTQVFYGAKGASYRTRLTHSMEVALIAKAIARKLGADTDLCEAIALCHDLGHPPFGHNGEAVLNDCMRDHGGFEGRCSEVPGALRRGARNGSLRERSAAAVRFAGGRRPPRARPCSQVRLRRRLGLRAAGC